MGLTFDAFDRMMEQNAGGSYTQLVYGPDGTELAIMNGQTLNKGRVPYPEGGRAVYGSGPTFVMYWRSPDWRGSMPFGSSYTQTVTKDSAFAPFGEEYAWNPGGTDDFTGQWAATELQIYDFPYREYHSIQGRWLTPDPAGLAAVNPANPQSWNRYAYALNNPLALVDPLGLDGDECADKWYAISHAECPGPPAFPDSPIGNEGGGGGGGGGGGAPPPPSPAPAPSSPTAAPGNGYEDTAPMDPSWWGWSLPTMWTVLRTTGWACVFDQACAVGGVVVAGAALNTLGSWWLGTKTGTAIGGQIVKATRGHSDPISGVQPINPGRDANGNCNPCPGMLGPWEAPGSQHGSTTGTHWHWMEWNQDPVTCTCYPKRGSGPSKP